MRVYVVTMLTHVDTCKFQIGLLLRLYVCDVKNFQLLETERVALFL
jgi:hypothetical protein